MNWFTLFALACWPFLWVTSVMQFGGPGAINQKNALMYTILILSYPLVIAIFYGLSGREFFFLSSKAFAGTVIVITLALLYGTKYPQWFLNLHKGILNQGYSITDSGVYYDAKLMEKADKDSFQILPLHEDIDQQSKYARDSKAIYHRGSIIPNLDAQSFAILQMQPVTIVKDKYNIFISQNEFTAVSSIATIDAETFQQIDSDNSEYWRDKKSVFYISREEDLVEIKHADPNSFQRVPLPAEDYWRDQQHVFFAGKVLEAANPDHFEVFPEQPYSFAKSAAENNTGKVYWRGQLIPNADYHSFSPIDHEFGKDKSQIFRGIKLLLNDFDSDSFTWETTTFGLAYDKENVYLFLPETSQTIEGINTKELEVLNNLYFKDQQRVYYRPNFDSQAKWVQGADAETFSTTNTFNPEFDAQDKNGKFQDGVRVSSQ